MGLVGSGRRVRNLFMFIFYVYFYVTDCIVSVTYIIFFGCAFDYIKGPCSPLLLQLRSNARA